MTFYHGSSVGGLKELIPFAKSGSNLKEPLVYMTSSRQLAAHYIWNTGKYPIKSPMLDIRPDGTLVFQEMFSGALEYFYKGLCGWIYKCEGDYQYNDKTGVCTTATSADPVPVVSAEFVEDVYEHIISYAEQGKFVYERFESLRSYRHDIIRGIIYRSIKNDNLFNNHTHPNYTFIPDKYPQYWEEAKVLYENGLL
ncbi:MAG: hypothetical protein LBT88_05685 [Oscillospiraceae bacterium]|jgi:hypothetical protein|nr:hypothetical protein [Oscillospiraceae bacterium]